MKLRKAALILLIALFVFVPVSVDAENLEADSLQCIGTVIVDTTAIKPEKNRSLDLFLWYSIGRISFLAISTD